MLGKNIKLDHDSLQIGYKCNIVNKLITHWYNTQCKYRNTVKRNAVNLHDQVMCVHFSINQQILSVSD